LDDSPESQLFVIKNAFTDIHYIEQFLYYWLVVATVEEFCFRGILLNYFIRIFGGRKIISILLSSIIFGGMHIISGASILSAIIAGIVLGSIFVITENLIVVIGLHAFSHGMFGFRVEMIDNAISTSVHHDLSYAYIAVLIIVVVLIPLLSHVVEKKFFSGFAN
jgi:membrane protease YdiL (CAAX protease family)